jgi:Legume lectin domain
VHPVEGNVGVPLSRILTVMTVCRRVTAPIAIGAALLLLFGYMSGSAYAQTTPSASDISYPDFDTTSKLHLNGAASIVDDQLQLTPDTGFEAGSAWHEEKVDPSTSFNTTFLASILGGKGDGIAFVTQNAGLEAIGMEGGSLGYGSHTQPGGIIPSVAVEFDTYKNGWDPSQSHIAVTVNGNNGTHLASENTDFAADQHFYAWIEYEAATTALSVYVAPLSETPNRPDEPVLTTTIDIPEIVGSSAYVGFTAGTGLATADQRIVSWRYQSGPAAPDNGGGGNGGATNERVPGPLRQILNVIQCTTGTRGSSYNVGLIYPPDKRPAAGHSIPAQPVDRPPSDRPVFRQGTPRVPIIDAKAIIETNLAACGTFATLHIDRWVCKDRILFESCGFKSQAKSKRLRLPTDGTTTLQASLKGCPKGTHRYQTRIYIEEIYSDGWDTEEAVSPEVTITCSRDLGSND